VQSERKLDVAGFFWCYPTKVKRYNKNLSNFVDNFPIFKKFIVFNVDD